MNGTSQPAREPELPTSGRVTYPFAVTAHIDLDTELGQAFARADAETRQKIVDATVGDYFAFVNGTSQSFRLAVGNDDPRFPADQEEAQSA